MARFKDVLPASEAERRRVFWVVAGCILVGLALLIALRPDDSGDDQAASAPTTSTSTAAVPTAPAGPAPLPVGDPMPAIAGREISTLPPAGARPSLMRFLRSWLPFAYGRGSLDAIEGATAACIADIRRGGVNTAREGLEPEITGLRAERDGEEIVVYAQIDDGSRYGPYSVAFGFVQRGDDWLCSRSIEDT